MDSPAASPGHLDTADRYDVVVIGSGCGGTTAAALLARAGMHVLLGERLDGPGGLAHSFTRNGYLVDPAIHTVFDQDLFDALLRFLGQRERCTFLPISHYYTVRYPGFELDVPIGVDGFVGAYVDAFPDSADELRAWVDLLGQVHGEARIVPPRLGLGELDKLAEYWPTTTRYGRATVDEVIADRVTDPRARAAMTAPTMLLGAPPSVLSFVTYAQMIYTNITTQPFYCQGGAQEIIDAMVAALEAGGGRLATKTEAVRILVDHGRVHGVEFADGSRVAASAVISNIDARRTFEELIGEDRLPAPFLRRLRRMRPSLTGVSLYAGTTMDLSAMGAPEGFSLLYRGWEESEWYPKVLAGEPWSHVVSVPTVVDPSLAPDGEHLLIVLTFTPYDLDWTEARDRLREEILDDLERRYPGLRDSLTFCEVATPVALERFTGAYRAAAYGWENSPMQTGGKRLSQETPIDGLFLAGHWTQPGSSMLRTVVSGVTASRLVLRHLGVQGGDRFAYEGLPPDFITPADTRPTTTPTGRGVPPVDSSTQDTLERNKQVVRRVIEEIWNQRNIDAADELIAENAYDHDLGFDEQGGLAGFKEHVPDLWGGSSDLRLEAEFMVAEGDKVAARVLWTGKHDGPMLGVPPSFNDVEFRQLIVYRIEDGKVAEIWKAGDVLGLLADMGVPAPNQTTAFGMLKFVAGMFAKEARRRFRNRGAT